MTAKVTLEWDMGYLFISFFMAFIGSYSAVTLAEMYRVVCRIHSQVISSQMTLVLMAISIGMSAIWSMHFVGMGALTLKVNGEILETRFDIAVTIFSLLAAIVCVYLGLYISSRDQMFTMSKEEIVRLILTEAKSLQSLRDSLVLFKLVLLRNPLPLICGGLVMGSGVVVMHYIGMMAMSTEATVHWDIGIVVLSIIIALVASCAAYWILFRLLALYPAMESVRIASACVMTIAVCAVHYTGMAAASYSHSGSSSASSSSLLSSSISKDLALRVAIIISLLYNYIVSMIVQAELRSCHYRLVSLDSILSSTREDFRFTNESFSIEYGKWREAYWKPWDHSAEFGRVDLLQDFLRRRGRYVHPTECEGGPSSSLQYSSKTVPRDSQGFPTSS
jgi:diguanylate cyclase